MLEMFQVPLRQPAMLAVRNWNEPDKAKASERNI